MKIASLIRMVGQNVRRSKKNLVMSSIGIIVGISTFVFCLGLGEGIKNVVLGRIFLVDQVEVVQKKFDTGLTHDESFLGLGSRQLDDNIVQEFKKVPGVKDVYPKMKFTFPTRGHGGEQIFGKDIATELIADGIEPSLVSDEIQNINDFKDFDQEATCKADADCVDGRTCQNGVCQKMPCEYSEKTRLTDCPGLSYCAEDTSACEFPIPVLVSHHLLEIYNGSLATALKNAKGTKMPKLTERAIMGFQLNITFGKSFLGRSTGKPLTRRIRLVGFSDKAITIGVTMPIGYVKRLNGIYSGSESSELYHSLILKVKDQTSVPQIVQAVRDMGFDLADSTENAEKAANIIKTVESVFALVSFVIVAIAAINISQLFFMIIYQRRREIGVLRALGASRHDVRSIILGEASVIGLFGGVLGTGVGFGASKLVDYVATHLPEFPYKPDTFFAFPAWVWMAALGMAILFCLLGAFFPANAAARQEPAQALVQ